MRGLKLTGARSARALEAGLVSLFIAEEAASTGDAGRMRED
jgi:hypothetical protein